MKIDKLKTENGKGKASLFKFLLFTLLPLAIILFSIEIALRLTDKPPETSIIPTSIAPDPDIIWKNKPLSEGGQETNELGFRDGPYNPNADYKILVLGDSVSWGDRMDTVIKTYPFILEVLLNSIDSEKKYEVINSGVPGYSTFQEAKYLELRGLKLKPDLIILQFCLNDVVERYLILAEYGGGNVFLDIDTRKDIGGISGFFIRHSFAAAALMKYLKHSARNYQEYDVKKLASDNLSPELKDAWINVFGEIDRIVKLSRENEIPLLLLIPPYRFQLDDPAHLRQPQDLLIGYCLKNQVPYLDLLPYFDSYRRTKNVDLFADQNHFSFEGNQASAIVLSERIIKILGRAGSE